ncbi:non-ribosomal peptide synthetase [Bacillus nakamurai]|uniref:non-ribosomal peptide synthetase n=1 Tax=Bacillus nakamurai TaxID=1793963 RepID=UPI0020C20E50|nr:non-ribosomal peptide synthetase [Bacillus nakamurai]MCP6680852.1 amino acid adenylation domain-containing protein [Bacillus nakamurai]
MSHKYRMSSAQKRIYALEVLQESSISYNVPTLLRVEGEINLDTLGSTFKKLCERHELLRTHFMHSKNNFIQVVEEEVEAKVIYEEVQGVEEGEILEGFVQSFDLKKAPLMRMKVVKNLTSDENYLLIDVHHIICDGESLALIFDELGKLYNDFPLPPLKAQYKNYSAWENKRNIDPQKQYWLNEFKNGMTPLELKTDFQRPAWRSNKGNSFNREIKKAHTVLIEDLCKKTKTTEYMLFMSSFMTLLQKYSHQEEIILGTPIAGRTHPDTHNMLGMFVNTLAIKGEVRPEHSFLEFLESIKAKCLKGYENQDYPFDELVKELNVERNTSRNPIFDVMFGLQNGAKSDLKLGEAELSDISHRHKTAKFDLTLMIDKGEESYDLYWEYSTDIFTEATIKRMADHFEILLTNILQNPECSVSKLDYMSEKEKTDLKRGLNKKEDRFPTNKSLIDIFEETVSTNASQIAIEFEGESLTYSELNERANYISLELSQKGVCSGSIVGIIANSSIDTMAAVLGVLKTGAAYLPLDPNIPKERLSYIISDSNMDALIVDRFKSEITDLSDEKILHLDELDDRSNFSVERNISEEDLAYVIYTSGSTGNPKGVMITHKNIINQVYWHITEAELTNQSKYIQNTAFIFDGSALEIFSTLLSGARLLLINPEKKKEPEEILKLLPGAHISFLPSMFRALMEYAIDNKMEETLNSFERLNLAAEKISGDLIRRYQSTRGSKLSKICNFYGPTEATVTSTSYQLKEDTDLDNIPIGKPVSNYKIYILNQNELCAKGVLGEICVGGLGVSKGYLNNKKLTEASFVRCTALDNELIYRTGDIGYINQFDEIELVGRVDEQVKIRGFRVELQEIETALKDITDLNEAVVVRKEDPNNDFLVAYFTSDISIKNSVIKDVLLKKLPEYMVPEFIIKLDTLPLLPNGKINKKYLGQLSVNKFSNYEKPTNPIETVLCEVFSEILGVEPVGISTSFFELGGDSIKAIRIVSKLRERGYSATVKSIMQNKTIKRIALTLKKLGDIQSLDEAVIGQLPLTPIQFEFFNSDLENPNHFNQSIVLKSRNKIDVSVFTRALKELVMHHDQLRAHYVNGKQFVRPETAENLFLLSERVLKQSSFDEVLLEIEAIGNDLQTSLDIGSGPLIKCAIINSLKFNGALLCIHHLLVDNISWKIILEDLNTLYEGYLKGSDVKLPQKTLSYKRWSMGIETYFQSEERKRELDYWKQVKQKVDSNHSLYKEARNSEGTGIKESELKIGRELTANLTKKAIQVYNLDVKDLLFTSLFRTMQKINGHTTVSLNMESHGRAEILDSFSIDRTVGWFTTMYPVVLSNIGNDIRLDIIRTKEVLRRVPNHGIGYGIAKKLNLINEKNSQPLITLNYFGEQTAIAKSDYFYPIDINSGKQIASKNRFGTPISINCEVINGHLEITTSYNSEIISTTFIKELEHNWQEQLNKVVSHCLLKKVSEHTASDFNETEWEVADFEYCVSQLSKKREKLELIYPLTPMQQGMLFHKMKDGESSNYFLQNVFTWREKLNLNALIESLSLLTNKHNILKTSVIYKKVSVPRQVISEQCDVELNVLDLTEHKDKINVFYDTKIRDKNRGFDLEEDSLLRFTIVKMEETDYRIIMSAHHIIMDGWSLPILVRDLLKYYKAIVNNLKVNECSKSQASFSDYVDLINKRKSSAKYWRNLLDGLEEKTSIIEEGKPENGSEEVKSYELSLNENETQKLVKISKDYNVTVNTIIEALWGILLQKYNNVSDSIFGKVVSGRNAEIPGIEQMVGLFINTIPVRIKSQPNQKFTDLLQDVQNQALNSAQYDHMSLTDIQNKTNLGAGMIQTILAFENYFVEESSEPGELQMEEASEQTNFDLALSIIIEKQLSMNLMYQTNKYNYGEISRVLNHFKNLLLSIIETPKKPISELNVVSDIEKDIILNSFNGEVDDTEEEETIVERLEKVVSEFPEHTAVECEGEILTYKDLNSRSNYLAKQLKDKGIKSNDVVGLISDRSCEMIVAIYAILKAGAAYLPIDRKQPIDRINYMINDSKARLIVVGTNSEEVIENVNNIPFVMMSDNIGYLEENLSNVIYPTNLAYVIYTSGTTGNPKGVLIEHRNVINLSNWLISHLSLDEDSIVVQNFSFIFDGSVYEIFPTLLGGSKLLILSDNQKADPYEMISCFNNAHIVMVPSMYRELLDYAKSNGVLDKLHSLKSISLAGEALTLDVVSEFFETSKGIENKPIIQNCYGPTEATVCSTSYEFKKNYSDSKVLVGKPIKNTTAWIMNQKQLVGIGMIGELFVGGRGVAAGYLNNEKLTKEKFIKHPYCEGEVLYQTGDLARWNTDGDIELLGRIDEQVKIRGFRIELFEIESCIRQFEDVIDAVVIVVENNTAEQIVAYFTANKEINPTDLKDFLFKKLNDYMVPAHLVQINEIPKTLNGKIDKRNLPKPFLNKERVKVNPKSKTEEVVYRAFQEVLLKDDISTDDNFLDIGGDSIKAIRVISKLNSLGYEINVRAILKYKNVQSISSFIDYVTQDKNHTETDINQVILDNYNKASLIKELKIDGKIFTILYVENLTKPLYENIAGLIERLKVKNSFIDFIAPLDKYENTQGCKTLDELKFLFAYNQLESKAINYSDFIEKQTDNYKGPLVRTYSPTNIQEFYCSTSAGIISEKLSLSFEGPSSVITAAILEIIKEHSALRSSYSFTNGEKRINEHQFIDSWFIPFNDMRNRIGGDNISNNIDDYITLKEYYPDINNPLSHISISQLTESRYQINLIIDHCIWDKASSQIFEEKLRNKIEGYSYNISEDTSYISYVEEVQDTIHNLEDNSELVRAILKEKALIYDILNNNSDKALQFNVNQLFRLGPNTLKRYRDDPWEIIECILQSIAQHNRLTIMENETCPVLVVQDERNHMNGNYAETLGCFLDLIPAAINFSKKGLLKKRIEYSQSLKKEKTVNFSEILFDRAQDIEELFSKVLIVNYQGAYNVSPEELQKWLSGQNEDFTSTEIFINDVDNQLIVTYPVFKGCKQDIGVLIQTALDELEESSHSQLALS